jgi:hypothetical protein
VGRLLVHIDGERRDTALAPSTLVGRHAACLVQLPDPFVPLYWLEIRWLGEGAAGSWAWRAMGALDHTRGTGSHRSDGWRAMTCDAGRGTRITLGANLSVELIDATPPAPFLVDLSTGAPVEGEALHALVEVVGSGLLPSDAEGDPRRALSDGDVLVIDGRAYRAHVPEPVASTHVGRIDLRRAFRLEIDLASLTATFHQGNAYAEVTGECVRVLAVYRAARHAGTPTDGWLSAADAYEGWRELGGGENLGDTVRLERMGWERKKLRSQLRDAGVAGAQALFDRRQDQRGHAVRLAERW